MKLISLNTWGGKYFDPLIGFIKENSTDTDVFCLQEIYDTTANIKNYRGIRANLLEELRKILKDFNFFYFQTLEGFDDEAKPTDIDLKYGCTIFVKKTLTINDYHSFYIYKDSRFTSLKKDFSNITTPLQALNLYIQGKTLSVFNFHGTPFPGDKQDTKERLIQSKKVKQIIEGQKGAKILTGDFNLLPQTESIKIFEEEMRNLIKEFGIERTRSSLSPFYRKEDFQKFADFTFVSKEIKVKSFEVPQIEISDHLPMILEFSN